MSNREAFEKWVNANPGYTYWDVWRAASGDCYGDGNVYRGVRSEDSSAHTISIETTMIVVNEGRFDNE